MDEIGEWVPLEGDRDVDVDGGIMETSFGGDLVLPNVPGDSENLQRLRELVESEDRREAAKISAERWFDAVRHLAKTKSGFSYHEPPGGIDFGRFTVDRDGSLLLAKPNPLDGFVNLTKPYDYTSFRSLKEVLRDLGKGGTGLLRSLGFENMQYLPSEKEMAALRRVANESDDILQAGPSGNISKSLEELGESLANPILDPSRISTGSQTTGLPLRELEGLDKTVQSIQGQIAVQEAKRSELQQSIYRVEGKLRELEQEEQRTGEPTDPQVLDREEKLLQGYRDSLEAVESSLADLRGEARKQVRAIKDLIGRILREDTSLAEKIRTIFLEQGVTIGAVVAALGAIIAAIVEGLTGGGATGATAGGKPSPAGSSAAKKAFDALANGLKWLAGKAAAALPGIIGSVVSYLLRGAAAVVSWLGSNLWAVLLMVGGVAYGVINRAVRDRRRRIDKT